MRKNYRANILVLFLFVFVGCKTLQQNRIATIDLLMRHKWVSMKFNKSPDIFCFSYSKDSVYSYMEVSGSAFNVVTPYYLSSKQDSIFIDKKVGKKNKGKYLIEKIATEEPVISEIIEINDKYMKLRSIENRSRKRIHCTISNVCFMKRLIISMIIMLSIAATINASDNPNYRSFKAFNNDTLAYLKYNFDGNEYYAGKTLGELFNDMEIQIKHCTFIPNFFGDMKVDDAVIYFDDANIVAKAIVFEKRVKSLLNIHVFFEPINKTEYDNYIFSLRKAKNKKEVNEDEKCEKFEKPFLENRIIKEITVLDVVR